MGDSSVSSDSAGDRSISPSRSEEPAPPAEPQQPVAPSPPSPVLFSKRLAEEAVAKRNSRLMLSQQMSNDATVAVQATAQTPIRQTSNGVTPPTKSAAPIKKKRAPAPPPPPSYEMNGPSPPKVFT